MLIRVAVAVGLCVVCCVLPPASLSNELVRLTSALHRDAAAVARLPQLEAQLASMSRRHDAAMQVIGEKEEELQECRQDLQEAKDMFKEQIQSLCGQIETLKKAAK